MLGVYYAVFRTDASTAIGTGHVMRCLTLAQALRDRGRESLFVCRRHAGHLGAWITDRGFAVAFLEMGRSDPDDDGRPAHAGWLGSSWREDADQTRRCIEVGTRTPEWLVADHYALDWRWEKSLRGAARRIAVIDDLADREHDCDLLLDQNLVGGIYDRYADKIPETCAALLGPRYAVLDRSYAALKPALVPRSGRIRRILVYFGADTNKLAERVAQAVLRLNEEVLMDIVLSANRQDRQSLGAIRGGNPQIRVHTHLRTLAPLMAEADFAVGAGGVTSWERLCAGLPALVVTTAENQRSIAEELDRRRLIRWLGHHDEVDDERLTAALEEHLKSDLDEEWSLRCMATVDGQGVNRVCDAMELADSYSLSIREARAEDESLLLQWANDPATRARSFSGRPISETEHHLWFYDRLAEGDACHMYVVEVGGKPAGQVRFDFADGRWRIAYNLAPEFRGRGLGARVLELGMRRLRLAKGRGALVGEVKADNEPSHRVFEALGFERRQIAGATEYKRAL